MQVTYTLSVFLNKLAQAGGGPFRREGEEFRGRCPAHADNGPSLYVCARGGKILINCKGGCTALAVCEAADHATADLSYDEDEPWTELSASGDASSPQAATGPVPAPSTGAAHDHLSTADLRHVVYETLLAQLELGTVHFEELRRRGLPPVEIQQRGYKTIDSARLAAALDTLLNAHGRDRLLSVPGFQERGDRVVLPVAKGFLIPVRGPAGHIQALKVRHDSGHAGAKYTWVSSKEVSCGNVVHVPLGVQPPVALVRLTEGELKADVATVLSGVPTVSAPGVSNWPQTIPVLKALGAKTVRVAFDQDGKSGTLKELRAAIHGLTREKFHVEVEWWDGAAGKGIDDVLAGNGLVEVVPGLQALVRLDDARYQPGPSLAEETEPEPAPFPTDVFPPALEAFCRQVAEATSTPPDFAGHTMLATAGAGIGNSRALCLKEHIWYESPRFYSLSVGDPASGKTPAIDAVVKPYQSLQMRLLAKYDQDKAAFTQAEAEYELAVKENRARPAGERQSLPAPPEEPAAPERFVAVDATVESLAPLLAANPRGLLMPQDEGVGWVRGMGQYKGGKGNDRQFWLSGWSGKGHMVDRKGQGSVPITIPRPFINVVGSIPPDMLGELDDHRSRQDGFLHRILFTFPRAKAGADWTEVTVSPESKQAWENTLVGLRSLPMQEMEDGGLGYRVVHFTPEAKLAWVEWWNAHAAEIRSPDLPVALIGPWGKLKSYTARLALTLYYLWLLQADQDEGGLGEECVRRAIRLIDYYKSHLRLVYSRLRQTPEENHVLEVIDWVRKNAGQCTVRELVRAKKAPTAADAKKLLKELEERGYGRSEHRPGGNGRSVPWFVFDPV